MANEPKGREAQHGAVKTGNDVRDMLLKIDYGSVRSESEIPQNIRKPCGGLWRASGPREKSFTGLGRLVLSGAGRRLLYRMMDESPTLWLSDDGRYWARDFYPGRPMTDIIEIETGHVWLCRRWRLTHFSDPRCLIPQFARSAGSWSNYGRETKSGHFIPNFVVGFSDFDMKHATPLHMARYEARFNRRVPIRHKQIHAKARSYVAVALATERVRVREAGTQRRIAEERDAREATK